VHGERAMVGVVANPASARDIRRLVADGAAVTTNAKLNLLKRVLVGLGSTGVDRVLSMTDLSGISAGLHRMVDWPSSAGWPTLAFVDQPVTQTAADTESATSAMVAAGADAIVVLGGDGTNRVVAAASGPVPLLSISTGTNNAFPLPVEPTVGGIAAGLVATNSAVHAAGTYRAKQLLVRFGDRTERALVDVAITHGDGIGSGAVWDPTTVSQLFLCFAETDAVGLSAIGGHLAPTGRRDRHGLALTLGGRGSTRVRPPISPGLVVDVDIASSHVMKPNTAQSVAADSGVIALDGERMFRFSPRSPPEVTLSAEGPVVIDVSATLNAAAQQGVLVATPARC